MGVSLEVLRKAIESENERLQDQLLARDEAQLALAAAQEALNLREYQVGASRREIEYLQGQIDEKEAEQEPVTGPDSPTNIPELPAPEPEVPWTPIVPADPEEGEE